MRSLSIIEKGVSLRKASVSVFHPHKYEKEKREKRATSLLVAASPSQGTDKPPLLNPVKWAKPLQLKVEDSWEELPLNSKNWRFVENTLPASYSHSHACCHSHT